MIGTLLGDLRTFMIVSSWVFLRIRNVVDKRCTENQNTHFVFNNSPPENRTVYDIVWKNIVNPDRLQMTIWHMCIACYIPKSTNTPSECVIFIFRCISGCTKAPIYYVILMYIACLV